MTPRSPALRAAVVAAPLLALLAIVALASRGGRSPSGGGVTSFDEFLTLKDGFFTIVMTLYALIFAGVVALVWYRRKQWKPPKRKPWELVGFAGVLAFTLLFAFGLRLSPRDAGDVDGEMAFPGEGVRPGQEAGREPVATREPQFRWPVAAGFVGVLAAAGALYFVYARRPGPRADDIPVAEELAAVVDDAIVDVRSEPDPRRAVIAAYVQMERAVASRGLERRRSEAPFEYLARILGGLRVRPPAVLALTELFERARFSTHTIHASMRDEAVEALEAVRDDLRAAA